MTLLRYVKPLVGVAILAGVAAAGYFTRHTWMPWLDPARPAATTSAGPAEAAAPTGKVLLTDQAITNLGLTAEPLTPRPYWKTILVPGLVVDRPGQSDRGVVAPITGVVTAVHFFPGETVRPADVLFTLRVLSEPFHQAQTDLFKATQDIKLAQAERKRIANLDQAIAGVKVIEVEQQITRLENAVKAGRQELLNRGLTPAQIDAVADGTFVKEVQVAAPGRAAGPKDPAALTSDPGAGPSPDAVTYEMQELKIELGQQVPVGQTLCLLANHQKLAIEGQAFPDETALLERAVREGWPVEADFQEPPGSGWSAGEHTYQISHLANTIDPEQRTFAFRMPLENESRVVERGGRSQKLWRFRPGQRVRLRVKVEMMDKDKVFILPADAVARDGPEAFIFTQNVNTFERRPVRVLVAERDRVVIANDGSLPAGVFVAQSAAAQLNRMAKSQTNTAPKGYHVHADGSLHKNEDEGK
jgi:membrane fusion protein, heavy metal efflux system